MKYLPFSKILMYCVLAYPLIFQLSPSSFFDSLLLLKNSTEIPGDRPYHNNYYYQQLLLQLLQSISLICSLFCHNLFCISPEICEYWLPLSSIICLILSILPKIFYALSISTAFLHFDSFLPLSLQPCF